ncbi:lamin tail domain-containing protein [Candidatus Pacearchaeota archaeon]|nr:lamin tail domain-containing protein [Candidatus Pacearchaeota archaeon]
MERRGFSLFLLFIIITFIDSVSSLQINEVMADCGNLTANCEFIELYSETTQDLSGYILDTNGQKLNLNASFQGFLVIAKHKSAFINRFGSSDVTEWRGMGLANSGDSIQLIYQENVVDSFSYSKANKNTSWQLINSEWNECEPTPIEENSCAENKADVNPEINQIKTYENNSQLNENEDKQTTNNSENNKDNVNEIKIIKIVEDNPEKYLDYNKSIGKEIIRLSAKSTNIYKSRNEKIKENAIYLFALLCIIIIAVLLIKRKNG